MRRSFRSSDNDYDELLEVGNFLKHSNNKSKTVKLKNPQVSAKSSPSQSLVKKVIVSSAQSSPQVPSQPTVRSQTPRARVATKRPAENDVEIVLSSSDEDYDELMELNKFLNTSNHKPKQLQTLRPNPKLLQEPSSKPKLLPRTKPIIKSIERPNSRANVEQVSNSKSNVSQTHNSKPNTMARFFSKQSGNRY